MEGPMILRAVHHNPQIPQLCITLHRRACICLPPKTELELHDMASQSAVGVLVVCRWRSGTA
eukprot:14129855-Alexandrium_andersonii.AAC.1